MLYVWLCIGLILLIVGGDKLVDGAVAVAQKLRLSPFFIGFVIIGFGTSLPELSAALLSVYHKSEGIALGNIIGSNIANILLVLGISACIYPVQAVFQTYKKDCFLLVFSSLLLTACYLWGTVNRLVGFSFIALLLIYLIDSYKSNKTAVQKQKSGTTSLTVDVLKIVLGGACMLYGADVLVDKAVETAHLWGISESVIGLTIVAVGTSLPELTAAVIAALKKENGVALGNVIGSNLYNALFITGSVAIVQPVRIPQNMLTDFAVLDIITLLFCLIMFYRHRFSRLTGSIFVAFYAAYMIYLF